MIFDYEQQRRNWRRRRKKKEINDDYQRAQDFEEGKVRQIEIVIIQRYGKSNSIASAAAAGNTG